MDENRCAKKVWHNYTGNRCARKAGFGNGGLYCKQHAKQYPAKDQETTTMYAARQEYNSFDVAVCQVYDVTDKTLVIHGAQAIFGYAPRKGHTRMALAVGQWVFFNTARAALEWVHLRMVNKANNLRAEITRIERNLEPVERMLKLEDLEDRVAEAVTERTTSIKRDLSYET